MGSLLVGMSVIAMSCSDENVSGVENVGNLQPEEFLTVTYAGQTYENVPTAYDENGDFVFLDEKLSVIYEEELSKFPELSTFIAGENEIIFYQNLEDALAEQNLKLLMPIGSSITTRAGGYDDLGIAQLFDDRDYNDRNYSFVINQETIACEAMDIGSSPYKFNDKCSSLKLTSNLPNDPNQKLTLGAYTYPCTQIDVVFIGYDDKNFADRSIVCVAATAEVKGYASLPGFNDKLSSFKLFFAQKGQYHSTI